MKDMKMKHRFIELRAQGKSLRAAADELGVGRQTLVRWEKKHKEEIENLKTMELEALLERHRLTLQAQIERYGDELARLHEEIEKRDIADVPTPKLYDTILKLYARVDAVYQMLAPRDDDQVAGQRALQAELKQLKSKTESAHERTKLEQASSVLSLEYESLRKTLVDVLAPYPELRQELSQRLLESAATGREAGNGGNGRHDEY